MNSIAMLCLGHVSSECYVWCLSSVCVLYICVWNMGTGSGSVVFVGGLCFLAGFVFV